MFNKKWVKRVAAVVMSASVLFAANAAVGSQLSSTHAEEAEREQISLALAEDEQETDAEATSEEPQEETQAPVTYDQLETTNTSEAAVSALDVSDVVNNTIPSIVAITTKSMETVESYFYGNQEIEVEAGGSGVIIAQNETELLIATNKHVVDGASDVTVCFTVDAENQDELLASAKVKGTSGKYDLAVIAVALEDIDPDVRSQLKIATMGSSDDLKVGEAVIVIGNALGTGQTVTTGIISALDCEVVTEAGTFREFQTDAAINFGCSGGAILNSKGEVIGIVSAKAVANYAENMGYGIPVDTAVPVLQDLINRETRDEVEEHGFLGITVYPVSDEAQQVFGVPAGAYVMEVTPGSAAEDAGIKKGDVITKFDGIDIASSDELVDLLAYYAVGETVTVELQSVAEGGEYAAREVEVTLQKGSQEAIENEQKSENETEQTAPEQDGGSSQNNDGTTPPFESWDDFGQFFFGDDFGNDRGGNGWY